MSGFDVMMRSQESVAQNQRFYDSQRYQGDQQMVQTLGQTAQFAVQQQNIQRELAMQEAEVGARLTSIQQQQQMDAYKLQMMAAMDQSDLGRESVKQAQIANRSAELDLQMKQKALENYGANSRAEQMAGIARMFEAAPEMWAQGMIFDPEKGIVEDKSRAKEAQSGYRPRTPGNPLLDRDRVSREIQRITKELESLGEGYDDASRARVRELRGVLPQLQQEYQGYFGAQQQQDDAGPQATGPQQQGFGYDTGMRQQQAAAFQAALAQPTEGPLGSIARMDPATQAAVSQGLAVYGEYLTKARGIAPDMAPRYVMAAAQRDPLPVMFALSNAGYSDARIRLWLLSTGKSEKDADNLLNLHRKELEELLRPVRGR